MNDMWQFNGTAQQWKWVSGNITTVNEPSVYGVQGVSGASNVPSGRARHAADFAFGSLKLYMFGGGSFGQGELNDLWVYDYATQWWTFISPGTTAYTTSSPYPGAREGHAFLALPGGPLFAMVTYSLFIIANIRCMVLVLGTWDIPEVLVIYGFTTRPQTHGSGYAAKSRCRALDHTE